MTPREEIAFCCGTCADKMKMMQEHDDLVELAYKLATTYVHSTEHVKAKARLFAEYERGK